MGIFFESCIVNNAIEKKKLDYKLEHHKQTKKENNSMTLTESQKVDTWVSLIKIT